MAAARPSVAPSPFSPMVLDEREWVSRTRAGNYAAFDAMFIAYADALCAYAYGLLRSREDAQEIVQDLFLWIWENRARWEVPGQLRTYLYRAVRNRAISIIRHRRVQHLFHLRSEAQTEEGLTVPAIGQTEAEERLESADLSERLTRALAALPERSRQAFLLSREHHMTYAQIAEVMQIAPKTVENHLARALSGLRQALSDLE